LYPVAELSNLKDGDVVPEEGGPGKVKLVAGDE
jgi:hypothetical protein